MGVTTTYHVEVLLNETKDEDDRLAIFTRFRDEPRYQVGDDLHLAWSGDISVDEPEGSILETVFAMFNRGSGSFVGDGEYPYRSLSVGDVVRLDETDSYFCDTAGWQKIGQS